MTSLAADFQAAMQPRDQFQATGLQSRRPHELARVRAWFNIAAGIVVVPFFGLVILYGIYQAASVIFTNDEYALTVSEESEYYDIIHRRLAKHLLFYEDADLSGVCFECLDSVPNGNMKRYQVNTTIKAMNGLGIMVPKRLFARAVVTVVEDERTAILEFVKLDGDSIYLDSSFYMN